MRAIGPCANSLKSICLMTFQTNHSICTPMSSKTRSTLQHVRTAVRQRIPSIPLVLLHSLPRCLSKSKVLKTSTFTPDIAWIRHPKFRNDSARGHKSCEAGTGFSVLGTNKVKAKICPLTRAKPSLASLNLGRLHRVQASQTLHMPRKAAQ